MFNFTKQSIIFDFMNQSKEEYLNYLKNLKSFVRDDQWFTMLSIDGLLNTSLSSYINSIINELSNGNYDASRLESIMLEIRNKISDLIDKFENNYTKIDERYFISREIYSLYGLIEVITEGSIITENILEAFKNKYKDRYLNVLKIIDNFNPSELTKFENKNIDSLNISFNSNEIQLYLLMKKWQDGQHIFHNEVIIDRHNKAKEEFEKYAKNKYPYLNSYVGLPLYSLYVINESPILEIEQIEKFTYTWFYKKLAGVIGGKNLGLAILKNSGVNVPLTYVIPVESTRTQKYLTELNNIPNSNYAIRSSATVEDNENQSFAGLFTSVLDVDKDNIANAGNMVYNSVFSDRVASYVEHFKTEKPYMSMVLQQFREPSHSGVWLGDSFNSGHLEWTIGNGEKLVSGKVKPTHEYWTEDTSDNNLFKVDNEFVGVKCLELQEKLATVADFEFCVVNGKLYFVQFRPVTKKIEQIQSTVQVSKNDVIGVPASFGYIEGHPIYLEDVEEAHKFKKGDILLTDFTDPKWVPIIMKASAIVTAEGGFLSHTAIISRELGIPCVTGVGYSNLEKLSNYSTIAVDGNRGVVSNCNKKKK